MAVKTGTEFEVHVDKGDVTGESWHGTFSAKAVLSFAELMRRDKIKREFIGPQAEAADPEVIAYATMLADLSVRLVEVPTWWQGSNHSDTNLLMAIWKEVSRIAAEHAKAIEQKGKDLQAKLKSEQK